MIISTSWIIDTSLVIWTSYVICAGFSLQLVEPFEDAGSFEPIWLFNRNKVIWTGRSFQPVGPFEACCIQFGHLIQLGWPFQAVWAFIYLLYLFTIALLTVNTAHLQYNEIKHVCEAVLGYFVVLAQNCLASTLEYIVMQMRKTNREKGYYLHIVQKMNKKKNNVGS